jgi:hypothetical protein
MFRKSFFAALAMTFIVIFLTSCATTDRSGFDNDCDYAKARYEEMQTSVRTYYALGTTSVAEIAIAERRLKRAKNEYEAACSTKVPDYSGELFEGVHAPTNAQLTGESNCRENGKKRDYEMSSGMAIDIARNYKSELNSNGWFTSKVDASSEGAGFLSTKDGRHLNFRLSGPSDGVKFINICVWTSQPNDDNCSKNCND